MMMMMMKPASEPSQPVKQDPTLSTKTAPLPGKLASESCQPVKQDPTQSTETALLPRESARQTESESRFGDTTQQQQEDGLIFN